MQATISTIQPYEKVILTGRRLQRVTDVCLYVVVIGCSAPPHASHNDPYIIEPYKKPSGVCGESLHVLDIGHDIDKFHDLSNAGSD